jgi:uncharacterized protein (TIGR02246 family)
MPVDDPVQAQLEAYNAHDLEAFLACYADDAVIRNADGQVLMRGREEISARYSGLFGTHPDVLARVPTRIRAGEWTVDEEKVRMGDEELHVAVAYRVVDGLIRTVVMLRSDS